jgi:glycoprotein endo-alpha-1,2-mannosidase
MLFKSNYPVMKTIRKYLNIGLYIVLVMACYSFLNFIKPQNKSVNNYKIKLKSASYKGLIMAGYQGWFNAEGDGAERGWNHYRKGSQLKPGNCKFDFWPEMSEYTKQYKSPFSFANGDPATLYSSYDESTVDLHFKWMKEYGIDGVFVQRFVTNLKTPVSYRHNQKVLASAFKSAKKYDRVICIMYDLSGMDSGDVDVVKEDWRKLVKQYDLLGKDRLPQYLCHNGKPLVSVWGAGFNDNRKYSLEDVNKIVDFLKNDPEYGGFSVMLGVPTHWRTLNQDTQSNKLLHTIIRKVDIVHPWFVGRYNETTYPKFKDIIHQDIEWCKQNKVDYVPTVFPGFSWHNMKPESPSNQIPRNKGEFYWQQMTGAITSGAEMIYVAMFDEIDEGTAIFKCAHNVPVGESVFVPIDKEIPPDYYLRLTGQATKMLRKEIPFQQEMPFEKL